MPESTHKDSTTLEFRGVVDQSLSGASNAAVRALGRVESAGTKASLGLTNSFRRAGTAMAAFSQKINTAGLLIGGAGIAAGLYAGAKAVQFFNSAIEAANEEGAAVTTRKLTVALGNIPSVARLGTKAIQEQVAAIGEAAEKMQHFSGTSAAVYRAGFATLVQFGATKKEIIALAKPMADYLAMTEGVNASQESSVELAKKIAAAIDTHKLGRFARELGLSPEQQKAWKGIKNNWQAIEFLAAAIEKRSKGAAAAQTLTAGARLSEAKAEEQAIMARYGESFKKIDAKWTTLKVKMETALLPLAEPFVEKMTTAFDRISDYWTKLWAKRDEISKLWKPVGDSIKAVFDAVDWDPAADVNAFKQINDYFVAIGIVADRIGQTWNDLEQKTERIVRLLGGTPSPQDTKAIIEDQKARAARGGQPTLDKPGTFPESPEERKRMEARPPDSPEERRRIEENAAALRGNTDAHIKLTPSIAESTLSIKRSTEAHIKLTPSIVAVTNANKAVSDSLSLLESVARRLAVTLGGNYGLHGGMGTGSGEALTYYGPGVPEDRPGGPTFDEDSYKGIGHIHGKEFHLGPGSAAMKPKYAAREYPGLKPGGTYFSHKTHRMQRWEDTSGARNPQNEDIFVPGGKPTSSSRKASGHTINAPLTINVTGDASKKALAGITDALSGHAEHLLRLLEDADNESYRVSFS